MIVNNYVFSVFYIIFIDIVPGNALAWEAETPDSFPGSVTSCVIFEPSPSFLGLIFFLCQERVGPTDD